MYIWICMPIHMDVHVHTYGLSDCIHMDMDPYVPYVHMDMDPYVHADMHAHTYGYPCPYLWVE